MEKTNIKILVVDDEPDILEFIEYNLKREGYQVFLGSNGQEAIEKAKQVKPDLILLDVMMPIVDGIEACKSLRELPEFKTTFIVFLTARSEEYSEIAGFNAGADDYIAKPIKPRVLLSRINAILRRKDKDKKEELRLVVGDLIIDRESFMVYRGDQKIQLAKKEFELLFLLATKPGKVFTRENILEKIWGDDVLVIDRTIDVHIRKVREKLGDQYISTVKGVGYKFEI
ncbi:MAG: response regulator transcription factor [Bacteroidia bacterium]|jgi:two-component system alkaline phosphatase synthesis response regulator PhoP|nr:response regulator transcription factor [Bacteroidia bacterium]MBP7261182.1 response regulator transcription factor [Bacteroidia bacterium]MBP9180060.1 response regulator transcription factor [Bacteroidia bacterium]MBP9725200.1 response regulator transcription factor [Bacteroidia bacterium]